MFQQQFFIALSAYLTCCCKVAVTDKLKIANVTLVFKKGDRSLSVH